MSPTAQGGGWHRMASEEVQVSCRHALRCLMEASATRAAALVCKKVHKGCPPVCHPSIVESPDLLDITKEPGLRLTPAIRLPVVRRLKAVQEVQGPSRPLDRFRRWRPQPSLAMLLDEPGHEVGHHMDDRPRAHQPTQAIHKGNAAMDIDQLDLDPM